MKPILRNYRNVIRSCDETNVMSFSVYYKAKRFLLIRNNIIKEWDIVYDKLCKSIPGMFVYTITKTLGF